MKTCKRVDNRKNPYNSKTRAPMGGSALLSQTRGEFKIRCVYCDKSYYSVSSDVAKTENEFLQPLVYVRSSSKEFPK